MIWNYSTRVHPILLLTRNYIRQTTPKIFVPGTAPTVLQRISSRYVEVLTSGLYTCAVTSCLAVHTLESVDQSNWLLWCHRDVRSSTHVMTYHGHIWTTGLAHLYSSHVFIKVTKLKSDFYDFWLKLCMMRLQVHLLCIMWDTLV